MCADSISDGEEMEKEFQTPHAETAESFQLGFASETLKLFSGKMSIVGGA